MPEQLSVETARREESDVEGWFIRRAFLLMLTGLGGIALLCWWIFPNTPHTQLVPYPPPAFPSPHLQGDPHEDLVRFYRAEIDQLISLRWIDRAKGRVEIPIDQAMASVVRDGIKGWPAPSATPETTTGQGKP